MRDAISLALAPEDASRSGKSLVGTLPGRGQDMASPGRDRDMVWNCWPGHGQDVT
eukprot:CAMPEP_0119354584 /NCGR_PEP_ID=MMETSP1334-20130426/3572_1 /TAXON_ID=127549 /ORGANISM="Calcidiscus leptoporus, Strain RCC1130" /LENGTH=54 /DNA_ID=CAMNT_0007368179 /DNA_START=96 /DNA_END=257 /DNA_ORIENTATION=+